MQNGGSKSGIIAIRVSTESKRIYVRTRKWPFLLAGVLFVIPWLLLAWLYFGTPHSAIVETEKDPANPKYRIESGPWGELDCYEFITDPPLEFGADELFPPGDAEWHFGSISREALAALLESADLPKDVRATLLAGAEFVPDQGWVMRPPDEAILNLSPTARKRIYDELAKNQANRRQVDPFIFKPAQFDAWLAEGKFSPAVVANVRKLLYPHGDTMLLADTVTLLKPIRDRDERRRLLNVLLRRSTVMVKLRLYEKSDIKALANYWGAGGRQNEVLPLLESLSLNPGGMRVDIALLLPPFARNRLYMYPLPSLNPAAMHRDCHWTAFNFFSDMPDDKYADPAKVKSQLVMNYAPISDAPRLGDIALLNTSDDRIVHSCVYIADDLYFSKNGPSHISPWVLMRLADVKALFPAYDGLAVKHYRLLKKS